MKPLLKWVFFIILALSLTVCRAIVEAETSITPEERNPLCLY